MPYMGDVLLLQEGLSAGLFLTPTGEQAAARAAEGGGGRPQDGAGGAHRRVRLVGAEGEGVGKAEGGVAAAADRHGAGACSWGGGGGAEGCADPDHVQHMLYLQAAAVELHSALSAQHHVAINMGVKEATLTELKGLLDKHPVAHLLDPKRRRAEEGEGSQGQGSKRSRK